MADTPLLVTADTIARMIGVPLPLTAAQRAVIEDEIQNGQDDVEGYLDRPLVTRDVTLTGLTPIPHEDPMSWQAWGADRFDDDFAVVSATEQPDGGWTVVFRVGLDGASTRAIIRYIKAHAAEAVRLSPSSGMGTRQITSMSAEGQSVSLEQARTTAGVPGGLPTLEGLARWRRRPSAYQSARVHEGPWPMVSAPVGWDPR